MRKFSFFLAFSFFCFATFAQTIPQWEWAGLGKDSFECHTNDICTDFAGNVYITGFFSDTLIFPGDTLPCRGGKDLFLAKYSATGQFLWAKCGGGPWNDEGTGLVTDKYGNVYLGGMFEDTAVFDNDTFKTKGLSDIMLIKYDSGGNRLWAKTWGSIYPDEGIKIFIDKNSNLFLAGMFAGDGASPPSYGTIDFDNITLTSNGGGDIFIAKLDSNATVKWAKHAGGKDADGPTDITVDSSGYIYITGNFGDPWADFDTIRLHRKVGGAGDMFIAKYDSSGNALWAKGAGGNFYPSNGVGVAADGEGNAYVTGLGLADLTKFDNNIVLNDAGSFIAKYNSVGNIMWAQKINIISNGFTSGMVMDAETNFYITGYFTYILIYNNDTLSTPGDNLFVVKYDKNGVPLWAKKPEGVGSTGSSIALDKFGNIIVGGTASHNGVIFGPSYIQADVTGILMAKLSSTTGMQNTKTSSATAIVYPDPASNVLHVLSNNGYTDLQLHDLFGHMVYEQTVSQKDVSLDISPIPNGIYYLQLSGKTNTETKKIMVQH